MFGLFPLPSLPNPFSIFSSGATSRPPASPSASQSFAASSSANNIEPLTKLTGLGSFVSGVVGSIVDKIETPTSDGGKAQKSVPPSVAETALPYLALSEASYQASGEPDGWERLPLNDVGGHSLHDQSTGFDAEVFRNRSTGEVNVSFRGSELPIPFANDWVEDGRQLSDENSPQYAQAIQLAEAAKRQYGNVSFTGHSLGAGMATAAGLAVGAKTYAFDVPGLGKGTLNALGDRVAQNQGYITNINLEGELASDLDRQQDGDSYLQTRQIGAVYYASAAGFQTIPFLLDNPLGRHSTVALRESLEETLGKKDTTDDTMDVLKWFGQYAINSLTARH